jgi:hypothetical protein
MTHIFQSKRILTKRAFSFFQTKVAHIEIIYKGEIIEILFPLLPMCINFPKSEKKKFHAKVIRNSTKAKLFDFMSESVKMIRLMQHEEILSVWFNKNKVYKLKLKIKRNLI